MTNNNRAMVLPFVAQVNRIEILLRLWRESLSVHSLRIRILIGCDERSFPTGSECSIVAVLLRTAILAG
jgi:hypothetical protein